MSKKEYHEYLATKASEYRKKLYSSRETLLNGS